MEYRVFETQSRERNIWMSIGQNRRALEKLPDEQSAFPCCYRRIPGTIRSSNKRWTGHIAGKVKK
jgi:hypothetical protein